MTVVLQVDKFVRFALVLALMLSARKALAEHEISILPLKNKIRIEIDNQLFTEYLYRGYTKPVFYPLLDAGGRPMTRGYPIETGISGEGKDHPHHKSVWFTHGSVNGVNFWSECDNCGSVVHRKITGSKSGHATASLSTANEWIDAKGEVICTDTRDFWFRSGDKKRALDVRITLIASHGDVVFQDTKEGTFGVRMHANLRLRRDNATLETPKGKAINSRSDEGKAVWGKRAEWILFSGTIENSRTCFAILDHPNNPRHPTWWHARDYGLVAANPFGIHDFEDLPNEPATGDFTVKNGDKVTFMYRLLLHEGDASQIDMQQEQKDFTHTNLSPRIGLKLP